MTSGPPNSRTTIALMSGILVLGDRFLVQGPVLGSYLPAAGARRGASRGRRGDGREESIEVAAKHESLIACGYAEGGDDRALSLEHRLLPSAREERRVGAKEQARG